MSKIDEEWQDFFQVIKVIAEIPTTNETPGVARDELLDGLICAARMVVIREETKNVGNH